MTEDFSNHPYTIGELRANKTQSASQWTVRDMLIDALREIDSGGPLSNAKHAVIVFGRVEENRSFCNWRRAGTATAWETSGLLQECCFQLLAPASE